MNIVLALCLMLLSSPTFAWDTSNIIDDPDFIEVDDKMENIPPEFKRIAKSIGRVSMSCTATHIGKGLALTAGHCLRASESVEYDQSCEGITIRWGYRGSKKKRLKSKCLRILVMQNKPGADYALLEVHPIPKNYLKINMRNIDYDYRDVTMFSHPRSRPLQWSQFCELRRLNPAPRSPNYVYHQCDTEPGSSGAPLIDIKTRKVLALHKGGVDFDDIGTWNFATPLSETPIPEVLKFLED